MVNGKVAEAAGELTKIAPKKAVAALYTRAGLDEEAYKLYAPADYMLEDNTKYSGLPDASLPAAVDEKPAVMHHKMTLNGQSFWYTASAGHLTAYAKNPEKQNPQASIFYTAYTRDDLPKENRSVTFFFNGGPGASSVYLHLASWAPKHVVVDALNVPDAWADGRPQELPFIDSQESLIDRTDLVFVDIVPGTGFSESVAPNTNQTFWTTDKDVELSRQFITRYINFNRRQESPKYLYGESYGGGIRVPKLALALVDAGTDGYEKAEGVDKSKFKVLTGSVFHSPAFDYNSMNQIDGDFPTYAMVADALGKSTARNKETSLESYAGTLGDIAVKYAADRTFIASSYTGLEKRIPAFWNRLDFEQYAAALMPGYDFNVYDGRMHVKLKKDPTSGFTALKYEFNFFEEDALNNRITSYMPEHVNYKPSARYINASWQTRDPGVVKGPALAFELWQGRNGASGLPNVVAAIARDPSLKLLTVHGYHDTVTPFRRSELDLKGASLGKRVPVKNFVGGHMIYYAQESRASLIKALDEFYDAPPYGTGPTIAKAQSLRPALAQDAAPVPTVALH
ncbi:MAG: hypothetical protein J0I92_00695 [Phyllobacterium sp.]|nr:hypothetical protein [Phyllobacterium sp.]